MKGSLAAEISKTKKRKTEENAIIEADSTSKKMVKDTKAKETATKAKETAISLSEHNSDASSLHLSQRRFDSFQLSPLSINALHSVLKYETMTVVQEFTFPAILKGQEIMARARTGTGKTIAFLLPAIELILKDFEASLQSRINTVVLCPTRELAQQVAAEAKRLLTFHKNLGAQVVYGGRSLFKEQTELSQGPCQILVATPGRLLEHMKKTSGFTLLLKNIKLLVLDEADRMLDMGFRESLDKILQALPSQRQTLLFSATIPKEIHNIAKIALKPSYEFIDTIESNSQDTPAQVKQQYMVVPLENQLGVLFSVLKKHVNEVPQYKVLVFCVTARVTACMHDLFKRLDLNSREIHSRKNQKQRDIVSEEFRQSRGGLILFTSDVSARGLDYPSVTFVIQVGGPPDLQQYIHRLGRTARAGKDGEGLLILGPWEEAFLKSMEKLPITQLPVPNAKAKDIEQVNVAVSRIDSEARTRAYQSWIGYYTTCKDFKKKKEKLIEYANQFSHSIGLQEPPALQERIVRKMGIFGVPGLRTCR